MRYPTFKCLPGLTVLFSILLTAAASWAEGSLTLIARTDEGRLKISLIEEDGEFIGEAREGWMVVNSLEAYYQEDEFSIVVGNDAFLIDRRELGRFKTYGGVVQDERGISAQAETIGSRLILMGTIEDEMNRLLDFEVRVDQKQGTLELVWEKNRLFLKKSPSEDGGEPGRCQGGLIKTDSEQLGRLWCKSSGTMMDAFFNNPDHILAWIVLPFVK